MEINFEVVGVRHLTGTFLVDKTGVFVMKQTRFFYLIMGFCLLGTCQTVFADIILSAPPRESVESGENFYGPIANDLSKLLGEPVIYEHPKNWVYYSRDMRAGKYDIVFDGPHFAAWRIKHLGHVAIAKLPGYLQFFVLSKKEDKSIKSMKDLLTKIFCGLASPNLGTVSAFNLYKNPVLQPNITVIDGGMRNVLKGLLQGDCQAAVVRDKVFLKLQATQQATLSIVARSARMPNQSITASSRLGGEKLQLITSYLTSKSGAKTAERLLTRFSKKNKFFVAATNQEFNGLADLLEGVVFGW